MYWHLNSWPICHSLTQTENNVKVEELFEDDANYPEPEDANYDKLNDFNEERKHVYTECTAEGWADQQVSNGGPRSL